MEGGRKMGWALVALDLGTDTTTPAGEMMANVLASFARYERRLIGLRTKDALANKRSQVVRLSHRQEVHLDVVERIVAYYGPGATLTTIAQRLTDEPCPLRACWWLLTVGAVLGSQATEAVPA